MQGHARAWRGLSCRSRLPRNADSAQTACERAGPRHLIAVCVAYPAAMLWSTAYLESRLPSPLPTKDGGNLYAVKDVRAYVLGLAHSRSGISIGNEPTRLATSPPAPPRSGGCRHSPPPSRVSAVLRRPARPRGDGYGMTDLLLRRVFALRQAAGVIKVTDDRQEPDMSSSL